MPTTQARSPVRQPRSANQDIEEFSVREIGWEDLRISLQQGWQDFMSKRGDLLFLGLAYPVIILIAAMAALNVSVLPLLFPLFAGSIILSPPVASGYYELARRREAGLDSRWRHFLDVVRGPAASPLADLTVITSFLFLFWILAALLIYTLTLGTIDGGGFATAGAFLGAVFGTAEGWAMIIAGNLVGFGFAAAALAISMVSFPMVVDKNVNAGVALRTSIKVARKNPVATLLWGLIVVSLSILGALPALVGLAVVFPVLGYATWHLYTRAVVR